MKLYKLKKGTIYDNDIDITVLTEKTYPHKYMVVKIDTLKEDIELEEFINKYKDK